MSTGGAGAIKAGSAFVQIFSTNKDLNTGLNAAEKAVLAFGQKVTNLGTKLGSLGKSLLTIGIGAATGIALASKAFVPFEEMLASIRSNTNLLAKDMPRVSKSILEMSKQTGQSATLIAGVFDELLKSGMSLEQVMGGTGKAVVKFARVSQMEAEKAATTITDVMNVFGVSSTTAMDTLSAAADASSVSLEQVVDSMSQFSTVGEQAGLSLQEVATAIALLGSAGIKGSDAGTSLKTMMQRLSAPADEGAVMMKRLGISVRNANRQMLPLTGIVARLQMGLSGLNSEAKDKAMRDIFGSDAIRAGQVLLKKGAQGLAQFNKEMEDSRSVSQKYAILMDTLEGSITRFKSAVERTSIALGEAFGPTFSWVIGLASGFLDEITGLIQRNKTLTASISFVVIGFLAVGGAMTAVSLSLKVLGFGMVGFVKQGMALFGVMTKVAGVGWKLSKILATPLTGAIKSLYPILAALNDQIIKIVANLIKLNIAFFSNPWNLMALALIGVVVALAVFTDMFQQTWVIVKDLLGSMRDVFLETWDDISATFNQALTGMAQALTEGDLWLAFDIFWQEAKILWMQGTLILRKIWSDWGNALMDVWDDMSYTFLRGWDAFWFGLQTVAATALYGMTDIVLGIIGGMQRAWHGFFTWLAAMWEEVTSGAIFTDFSGALERVMAKVQDRMRPIDEETAGTLAANAKIRDEVLAAIEKERQARARVLQEQQQGAADARRQASAEAIKANQKELETAKKELDELTKKAEKLKDVGEKLPKGKGIRPDEVGRGLEKAKSEVRGTFSAIGAARGLGAGESVSAKMDQQILEAKQTNQQLTKLNKKAGEGKLVFK